MQATLRTSSACRRGVSTRRPLHLAVHCLAKPAGADLPAMLCDNFLAPGTRLMFFLRRPFTVPKGFHTLPQHCYRSRDETRLRREAKICTALPVTERTSYVPSNIKAQFSHNQRRRKVLWKLREGTKLGTARVAHASLRRSVLRLGLRQDVLRQRIGTQNRFAPVILQ